jgi:hypothetical protein
VFVLIPFMITLVTEYNLAAGKGVEMAFSCWRVHVGRSWSLAILVRSQSSYPQAKKAGSSERTERQFACGGARDRSRRRSWSLSGARGEFDDTRQK